MTDNSSNALTLSQQAQAGSLTLGGKKFKMLRQITRTVLQQAEHVVYGIRITSPIYESEALVEGKTKMQPARMAEIDNLETGELQIIIANSVLEGELNKAFPNNGYVGKAILIRSYFPSKGIDDDGKPKKARYRVYQIAEIEEEEDTGEIKASPIADGSDPVDRAGKPLDAKGGKTK